MALQSLYMCMNRFLRNRKFFYKNERIKSYIFGNDQNDVKNHFFVEGYSICYDFIPNNSLLSSRLYSKL